MSTLTCQTIVQEHLTVLGRGFSCGQSDGSVWIVSPYAEPDGDNIEISVTPLSSGSYRVSDVGETLRHLVGAGFDPRSTEKGSYLLTEILKQHHVSLERGMITKIVEEESIGEAVRDVLLASLRTAQLIFLSRTYRPATFDEEVARFLADEQVGFEANAHETGVSGTKYTIDFLIRGQKRNGLLKTLSPATPAGMTIGINAAVRLWVDVPNGRWRGTLLNDEALPWRTKDVSILSQMSTVLRWSERESALRSALKEM